MNKHIRMVSAMAILAIAQQIQAQSQNPTVEKILQRGQIVIGHRTASPPFGYLADNGQVTGYSVEICKYVADYIKTALQRPDLKTGFVPADPSNRIPLVQNGTIDMECAGTANTLERQKVVAFTYNIMYTDTRFLVRKSSGIKTVADLKGKSVSVVQGVSQQKMLADLDKERGLGVRTVMAKDVAETFLLVENGRADATIYDPILLSAYIYKSKDAPDFVFLQDWGAPPEAVSIMIAKGDDRFKALANEGIKKMMDSGDFAKNYDRWFMTAPFKLPMSTELKEQIRSPNDNGSK